MKTYRMPFQYWMDEHYLLLRKTKGRRWADDPEYYMREHLYWTKDGSGPYFLNRRCRSLMDRLGPFSGKYQSHDTLCDRHVGETAYVFCPGPTMGMIDHALFDDRLTFSVNSAGFRVNSTYWVMAESGYALWLLKQDFTHDRTFVATGRVASILRDFENRKKRDLFGEVFVIRWMEEHVTPARTPAVSTTEALVTAWQMGCKKAVVFGLDLSKKGGAYVKGVPHTSFGAKNPFDDQIRALKQFELPDFEVLNCSPLSQPNLPNFTSASYEEIAQSLRSENAA